MWREVRESPPAKRPRVYERDAGDGRIERHVCGPAECRLCVFDGRFKVCPVSHRILGRMLVDVVRADEEESEDTYKRPSGASCGRHDPLEDRLRLRKQVESLCNHVFHNRRLRCAQSLLQDGVPVDRIRAEVDRLTDLDAGLIDRITEWTARAMRADASLTGTSAFLAVVYTAKDERVARSRAPHVELADAKIGLNGRAVTKAVSALTNGARAAVFRDE